MIKREMMSKAVMVKKVFYLSLLTWMFVTTKLAYSDEFIIGNGGDGVQMDGGFYLLDFAEVGIEKSPFFLTNIELRQDYIERVNNAFDFPVPTEKIVAKLMEIEKVNSVFALILLKTMEMYDWRLVDYELVNVPDEDTSMHAELYQIALRRRTTILMHRLYWNQLDESNKAGLIFHELVYAAMRPEEIGNDTTGTIEVFAQLSPIAREINAYLFSGEVISGGMERMKEQLSLGGHDYFPIIESTEFLSEENRGFKIRFMRLEFEWNRDHHREGNRSYLYANPRSLIEKIRSTCTQRNLFSFEKKRVEVFSGKDEYSLSFSKYQSPNGPLFYVDWKSSFVYDSSFHTKSFEYTDTADVANPICVEFVKEHAERIFEIDL